MATRLGRKAVKYGIIALVVMIVGRMLLTAAVEFWRSINPPPPPPPTVGFGLLPKLLFPTQTDKEKPKSFKLETGLGNRLPELKEDRAKVFLSPKVIPNLLADQEVKQIAAGLGFIFEPELLTSRLYRWTKTGTLDSSLEIDLQTKNFLLETNYLTKPELVTNASRLPEEFEAVRRVKAFLDRVDLLPVDVATNAGEVIFLKSLGNKLEKAFSLSDADFLQINLDRTPIDGVEMYSPEPDKGVITAILSGVLSGQESIVRLENHYRPIDYTQVETYPLRSAKSAWQILQTGEGFIARSVGEEVVVRKVTLGYYEDWFNEQAYLQPIYVFSGDNDFVGYVQAIDPQYISQ
ncbi:MAG: hypothetical protein A2182_03590 [Candidatus Pacebacteria bacterium RIFOXYA1_FULL_38_18]|nr:MAG: hypothetical protein A2182_03590 [Candidatus Pacebacteria bacterium RIFOXYA1_FULL_38_18]